MHALLILGRQPKWNAKQGISSLNFLCFHLNTFHTAYTTLLQILSTVFAHFLFTLFTEKTHSYKEESAQPLQACRAEWAGREKSVLLVLWELSVQSHTDNLKRTPIKALPQGQYRTEPRGRWGQCLGTDFRGTQGCELTNTFCTEA